MPTAKKVSPAAASVKSVQPGRIGRVVIAGHFLPAVQRELKILAAKESTTIAQLLREALTLVFAKRGIASVDKLEGIKEKA